MLDLSSVNEILLNPVNNPSLGGLVSKIYLNSKLATCVLLIPFQPLIATKSYFIYGMLGI
jgi:hypothetical protein